MTNSDYKTPINEIDLTEGGTDTTSQIVKKVFDMYGEEWLQFHQDSQIVEILDRLEGLDSKIERLTRLFYAQTQQQQQERTCK